MGKTNKSITQLIEMVTGVEMANLYDALDGTDKGQVHSIFKHLVKYKVPLGNAKPLRQIEATCILMLLVVYKQNKKLHHLQYEQMRQLRHTLEEKGLIDVVELIEIEEEEQDEETFLLEMVKELGLEENPELPA